LKQEILEARAKHPNYGTDRLCIYLKRSRSVVARIIKKYNLQLRKKRKKPFKPEDQGFEESKIPNLTKDLSVIAPNVVWATDFTYLKFRGKDVYLATYIDLFTREIIAWNLSDTHDTDFVLETFRKAVKKAGTVPSICHSDQGSEYRSRAYQEVLASHNIKISMSPKSSPWRNGFQESYYRGFKEDLGQIKDFEYFGELYEAVAHAINYYNEHRIHSALKMAPKQFSRDFFEKKSLESNTDNKSLGDNVITFLKLAY